MFNRSVIECGEGWKCLYQPIIDKILEHDSNVQELKDKIGIRQIKEKFGLLQIYIENEKNASDELLDMISNATRQSRNICEFCGTKEHVGSTRNFWFKTCCKSCWERKIKSMNNESVWKENL